MSSVAHVIRIGRQFPVASTVVAVSAIFALAAGARRLIGLPEGLDAHYFIGLNTTVPAARSNIDSRFSTAGLAGAWPDDTPPVFSATWRGALLILHTGTYTFATISDDGSTLAVDGVRVVDNSGSHPPTRREGTVELERGVHEIAIDYSQEGVAYHLEVLWSRGSEPPTPLPASVLAPRTAGFTRFVVATWLNRAAVVIDWAWVGALVLAAGVGLWRMWVAARRRIAAYGDWPALRGIVLASLALNLLGIWWGLPAEWVQIELTPRLILDGLVLHFSHGWSDTYPPFQFYVLTVVMSPILLLHWLGRLDINATTIYPLLLLAFRLVSIAAGMGIVIAGYVCGARVFSRRAGLFAAAIVALVAPFLYYAKTANLDVPYLFWFVVSLVFFLRLLETLALKDFVIFALAAMTSICTKDQAYGLYVLMPIAILMQLWREKAGSVWQRAWQTLFDRRIVIATLAASVLFVVIHNLIFNLHGFIEHVRVIVGPGSQEYRMFDATMAGRLALLRLTGDLIVRSMGWPLLAISVAGVVLAVRSPRGRWMTFVLALPVISYYLTFINVILYNYDRFVLPICFVLALFGGFTLDRLFASVRQRVLRIAVAAGAFAYTLLYAGAVDVLMMDDSRYGVQEWMAEHVEPNALIGTCFDLQYLPNVDPYRHMDVCSRPEVARVRPEYVIINADYAQEVPPDSLPGTLIAGLMDRSLGYRLVIRRREPTPWPWLPGAHPDLVGPRNEYYVASTLRNINPTIAVFARDDVR